MWHAFSEERQLRNRKNEDVKDGKAGITYKCIEMSPHLITSTIYNKEIC